MELHRRRTGLIAGAAGVVAAGLGAALLARLAGLDRRVPEALLILAVVAAVAGHRPLRQALAGFDRRHQALAAGVLLALFAGQFLGTKGFPFVSWRMYGAVPGGRPTVYEYDGVRADASSVPLSPSRLLGGITANRFENKLAIQIDELRKSSNPDPQVRREHEASVVALAHRYNDAHRGAPIATVVVTKIVPPSRAGEVLWRIPVS